MDVIPQTSITDRSVSIVSSQAKISRTDVQEQDPGVSIYITLSHMQLHRTVPNYEQQVGVDIDKSLDKSFTRTRSVIEEGTFVKYTNEVNEW